jgi:hypothetical protein
MEARARRPEHRAMRRTTFTIFTLALLAPAVFAQSEITITLYDIAGLPAATRMAMKAETSRIFQQAGVNLEWVDCEIAGQPMNLADCARSLGKARLMLQLVSGKNKEAPKASGMAVIQDKSSVFAWLYPERVHELAREANWEFGDLLGHAAAHELGHLLLRSSAHTPAGVMRERWETEDLRKLSHAGLIFLPGQLSAIQAAISRQRPGRPK